MSNLTNTDASHGSGSVRETGQPGSWLVESGGTPQGFAIFPHAYDSEGHSGGAGVGVFGMHMILRLLSRAFVLLWIRIHMIPLKLAVERLAKSG